MRHLFSSLLGTIALVSAAHATTVDFTVSKDPNGFNVHEVTKDAVKLIPGGPFGSNTIKYVWTDGSYIYAVNSALVSYPNGYSTPSAIDIVTYKMGTNAPEKISSYYDVTGFGAGGCGHCGSTVDGMVASPQHLFIEAIVGGSEFLQSSVFVYHKKNGVLTPMCSVGFPLSATSIYDTVVTSIRVDANAIYAYFDYTDPATMVAETAVYDISTAACKQVGTVAQ